MARHARPTPEFHAGFDRAYAVLHGADPAQPALPPEVLEELPWEDRITLDALLEECHRIYSVRAGINASLSDLIDRLREAERGKQALTTTIDVARDMLDTAGYGDEIAAQGWLHALAALIDDHRLPGSEAL